MNERNERLERFFTDNGLEKVFVRCYGIGGHFYNVEVRTVSPITLSLVKELFDRKFFNIRITDNTKTKMILNMEIYVENLDKI
jgi:hypothetical protein